MENRERRYSMFGVFPKQEVGGTPGWIFDPEQGTYIPAAPKSEIKGQPMFGKTVRAEESTKVATGQFPAQGEITFCQS